MNGRGFKRMKKIFSIHLSVLLAAAVAFADQEPQWKGTIVKEGDVTVVKNPKEPIYNGEILMLKEEIAIGGAEAKEPYSFAVVRSLAVDDAGNIYALDEKDIRIKVFDKNGKHIRSFGQKGQGPGDLDNPSRITIDRSRNALMVRNGFLGIAFFGYDGKYQKSITTDDAKQSKNAEIDSNGCLVLNMIRIQDMEHRWDVLKKYNPDLKTSSEIKSIWIGSPYDVLAPMVYWTLDPKDNIVFGYPKEYEIQVFGPQNKLVRKILKDHVPFEVSPEEKDRISKRLKQVPLPPELASKITIPKYYSAYPPNFIIDDLGRLFVANWEKKGKDYIYDLFDPEGRYLARFVLPYKSILFKIGKLYTIEEDEDGYQTIKRYAVSWNLK